MSHRGQSTLAETHCGDFTPLNPTAQVMHSPPQIVETSEDKGQKGAGEGPEVTPWNSRTHQIYLEFPGPFPLRAQQWILKSLVRSRKVMKVKRLQP